MSPLMVATGFYWLKSVPQETLCTAIAPRNLCPSFTRGKEPSLVCCSPMFRKAYSQDGKIVFYLDSADNKYAAMGGSLAWRLNNPGLVHTTSRFFSRQGSIGHFGLYAIFVTPEKGREALANWLHTKKYFQGSLKTIAKHYKPDNPDSFSEQLSSLTDIPVKAKIKTLTKQEFDRLLRGIEKLCGYTLKGNETLHLMPKILGKIEMRIFTFGGGSFISEGKSHPDSHNYASVADFVCLGGSPNLQTLALKRYHARKEGLTDAQMIQQWSFRDAILELDSIDPNVIKKFAEGRAKHYQDMFARINNLTILDPDPDSRWKHEFASNCYQTTVQQIIQKYRKQYVKPFPRK